MKRVAQTVLLLSLAGLVGACSTVGDVFDKLNPFAGKTTKIKPAELVSFQPTVNLRTQWSASIGKGEEFTLTPAVVGDSVYVASKSGRLARYDKGNEVWRINVDQQISGGVGADKNVVAVGTSKGEVLAFQSADGAPKWKARASSEVLAAPAVGEGLVIVRSGDSRVFAFEGLSALHAGVDAAHQCRRVAGRLGHLGRLPGRQAGGNFHRQRSCIVGNQYCSAQGRDRTGACVRYHQYAGN
jgi:outer membrane protein assembly factor BamB